jgi:hypothetical protein
MFPFQWLSTSVQPIVIARQAMTENGDDDAFPSRFPTAR